MTFFRYPLFPVFALCLSASVSAIEYEGLSINGFLTAGAGIYDGNDSRDTYSGYDDDLQINPVTRIGLQVRAQVNERLVATGQLLARGTEDYHVQAEWAYLSYAVNEAWDLRIGRLRAPLFLYSDFLDVSYAYPWITPPKEVYRLFSNSVEGIDTVYQMSLANWDATIQAYYGRLNEKTLSAGEDVDVDLTHFTGANISVVRDWLTLRASANRADFDVVTAAAFLPYFDGFRVAGFDSVADTLELKGEVARFYSLAASVDYRNWLLTAEYTITDLKEQSIISDDTAWYVHLGHKVGDFLVHVTYQAREDDPDFQFLSVIPDGISPDLDIAKATAKSLVADSDTEALSLGLRYDFAASSALKVEITRLKFNHSDDEGTLFNFAIDTVF